MPAAYALEMLHFKIHFESFELCACFMNELRGWRKKKRTNKKERERERDAFAMKILFLFSH